MGAVCDWQTGLDMVCVAWASGSGVRAGGYSRWVTIDDYRDLCESDGLVSHEWDETAMLWVFTFADMGD